MDTLSHAQIKWIKSLSSKKYRDEYGSFTVEGEKLVEEALRSGYEVTGLWRREEIGDAAMARISSLASPSPVLAVVRKPADLHTPVKPEKGLFLALDSIRDPGNLGTILRIADWFGIDAVYASPDTVDVFNPKVVQSTMGAIFRVKFHYVELEPFLQEIRRNGGAVYGTFLDGRNLYAATLSHGKEHPCVIVMGNESEGISRPLEACVTDRLLIPPYPADDPGSESLNVAVATAITVAEFRRRG